MFLHEFRDDFVLALELLFQEGDLPVLAITGANSQHARQDRIAGPTLVIPIEAGRIRFGREKQTLQCLSFLLYASASPAGTPA